MKIHSIVVDAGGRPRNIEVTKRDPECMRVKYLLTLQLTAIALHVN